MSNEIREIEKATCTVTHFAAHEGCIGCGSCLAPHCANSNACADCGVCLDCDHCVQCEECSCDGWDCEADSRDADTCQMGHVDCGCRCDECLGPVGMTV